MCQLKCSPKQCLPIMKVCRIDKLMCNINIAYTKWPLSSGFFLLGHGVTSHRTIIALDSVIHFIIITRKVVGCSCGFSDLQGSVYHSIQCNRRPFLHLFTFWLAPDRSKSSLGFLKLNIFMKRFYNNFDRHVECMTLTMYQYFKLK